jgi:hypothetical protein
MVFNLMIGERNKKIEFHVIRVELIVRFFLASSISFLIHQNNSIKL